MIAFAIHGELVVGTDDGEWFTLGPGDQLSPAASTGRVSAAVCDAAGTLTIASWEPKLTQLRARSWTTIALAAPALALAATPRGLVIADAGGGLSLLAGASRAPVQELSSDPPVLALAPRGEGIVALLANGTVATSGWPDAAAAATLAEVDTSAIGRVHALFPGPRAGSVLVAGARGYGLLDGVRGIDGRSRVAGGGDPDGFAGGAGVLPRGIDRLVCVASDLGGRIAGTAVFGGHGRALLYTDEGDGCIIDERLVRSARLAIGAIAGCTSGDDGAALAWTATGALHAIDHRAEHRTLADGGVVLAAPEVGRIGAIAIRWTEPAGVRITRGHVAWT